MRSRVELVLALVVIATGVLLLLGALRIGAGAGYDRIGPRLFPYLVATGLVVLGGCYAVSVWWSRRPIGRVLADDERTRSVNWRAFGYLTSSFLLLVVMLDPVGFVLASSVQFWLVTQAFGSRTRGRDALVAVVVALSVYLAFSRGLGLALP